METGEQRRHKRLNLKLELYCQLVGDSENKLYPGHTLNISTSGVLAQIHHNNIKIGDLVNIRMSVPPTQGILDFGGRIEAFAKIVRATAKNIPRDETICIQTLAMQFCDRPKFSI